MATTDHYLNRELSWLEFNQRVLDEARNPAVPLLQRLKFLAITASNLDEFFMVRVGGLHGLASRGIAQLDPLGLSSSDQLEKISQRARRMLQDQYACWNQELEPELAKCGVQCLRKEQLSDVQVQSVVGRVEEELLPVLTPIAVSDEAEFPLLSNHTLHLCVRCAPEAGSDDPRYAIVPFLGPLRRFLSLPVNTGSAFLLLEEAIAMTLDRFFPGETVNECVAFRIVRNADLSLRDEGAYDLLAGVEEVLDARKQSATVRLEIAESTSDGLLRFLQRRLGTTDRETYRIAGPLDLAALMQLSNLSGFDDLQYPQWSPQPSPHIDPSRSMFEILQASDVLLCHPYESFEPVLRLLDEAADDPDVLAIKQTLYRTSRRSPIVSALKRAAESGKNVTALIEVKARFDEARNIEWAKQLEQARVQVIYGVKGLKTHAKMCLIVRREAQGIRRYLHLGTGNYNESTARLYSDVSYMTCQEGLAADATACFNAISGYSQPQELNSLEMAPIGLREKLLEMIEIETQRKLAGERAHIVAKLNSLVDTQMIDALYAASQAGVTVKLNIRGICCLRPGVSGLSENIEVISIVDRYLEHARIFYFFHGGDERVFISSADWMPRNLDRRIELLIPIEHPGSKRRLIRILDTYFRDNVKARRLLPDGTYEAVREGSQKGSVRSQELLYQEACELAATREFRPTVFEPHRATGSE
ncbi:MAG: polyphosphate kinase 1 [Planctomycetaceae bacterium]|nr:polyphosphate kinase 1 [Planctomycetaceae bacterium]HAA71980.1 polyphosphate kinase 1 [Planctomycetaceae bacterium]|tara:strand:+ start:8069 stop:10174 length:2106 start_codon:yes stop_codon:yes gene_type:complete